MELRSQIQSIALRWPAYGYRRMQAELERQGWRVNHKRVLQLMRVDNLLGLRRRKFILTTDSKHGLPIYPNLAKDLMLTDIHQLWVADITYIRLAVEFVYLAVLVDAFSRSCVGWALQRSLEAALELEACAWPCAAGIQRWAAWCTTPAIRRTASILRTLAANMVFNLRERIPRSYEGSPYATAFNFTAPANDLKIANRELGLITGIDVRAIEPEHQFWRFSHRGGSVEAPLLAFLCFRTLLSSSCVIVKI